MPEIDVNKVVVWIEIAGELIKLGEAEWERLKPLFVSDAGDNAALADQVVRLEQAMAKAKAESGDPS